MARQSQFIANPFVWIPNGQTVSLSNRPAPNRFGLTVGAGWTFIFVASLAACTCHLAKRWPNGGQTVPIGPPIGFDGHSLDGLSLGRSGPLLLLCCSLSEMLLFRHTGARLVIELALEAA